MAQITVPSWQAENQECERCGAVVLRDSVIWLEHRTSTGTWHLPGAVMEWNDPDNQGVFPFGATCAEQTLKNGQDW